MSKITVYAYDALGRVEKIKYGYESSTWPISASALASITDYDLVYDYVVDTDLVSSVTQTTYGNEDTWYYGYDARGRLTSYKPAWPAGFGTISYTYNNAGQKTSMSVPIGVTGKGRKMIYKYDSTGKRVGMDVVPCQIADAGDCWLDIPEGPQPNARYFYDPDNNRSAMITKANGDIYYFVYDPTASIPSVVYEQGPAKRYLNIREPDGSLVSRETYNWYGVLIASRTYHYDGLGSTVALTDENGQVTDKYSYDEWGNVTPDSGNITTDNPYQYVGRYGYYTHYQEPEFGLMQLGVRFYDAETGRFTQRDPAKDGINWYDYVAGNPLGWVDPTGRIAIVILGCVVGAAELAVASAVLASYACGANEDCKEAVASAINAVIEAAKKATTAVSKCCNKILRIRCNPPWTWNHNKKRHPFVINGKKCWMDHIHLRCHFKGIDDSEFFNKAIPYGPCYKYPTGAKTH